MSINPSDVKPNPADPLLNPPAVPEVFRPDLPLPLANEPPPDQPTSAPGPILSPIQPDHPLGPHTAIERTG